MVKQTNVCVRCTFIKKYKIKGKNNDGIKHPLYCVYIQKDFCSIKVYVKNKVFHMREGYSRIFVSCLLYIA